MSTRAKKIILFLTPFVMTIALFVLGVLFGFELVVLILALMTVAFCFCVVAELLLDRFGD